jgi:hypothetical protein
MAFVAAPLRHDMRRRSLVAGAAGLLLLVGLLELQSARVPEPARVLLAPSTPAALPAVSSSQRELDPVAVEVAGETASASRSADRALVAEFRALDPEALAAAVEPVLSGGEPGRQAALLRALYETGSRRSAEAFLRAIRSNAKAAVATFAVRFLAGRSQRDPAARAILREAAFGEPRPEAATGRWAAARFAATASSQELWLLPQAVFRSEDPLLADSVASALAENVEQDAARQVLYALGRPAPSVGAGR